MKDNILRLKRMEPGTILNVTTDGRKIPVRFKRTATDIYNLLAAAFEGGEVKRQVLLKKRICFLIENTDEMVGFSFGTLLQAYDPDAARQVEDLFQ